MNNHYDPNQPRNAEGEWTDAGDAIKKAASDKKPVKAYHNKFGELEILSVDNNVIEVKLADGTIKNLPLAYTQLRDSSGNIITDFSNVPLKQTLPVIHEIRTDEELNAWKNKPKETVHLNVVRETEKAVAIEATAHHFSHNEKLVSDTKLVWIPKSMLINGKAPKWLVDDKVAGLTVLERGVYKTYHYNPPK